MPNYCSNKIEIRGSIEDLNQIKNTIDALAENEGVFKALVGIKPGIKEEEYKKCLYDTNVEYWGTKWDVMKEEFSYSLSDDILRFDFDSAWSPANGFIHELSKKYNLSCSNLYSESGIGFSGYALFEGEFMDDSFYENSIAAFYYHSKEEFIEILEYRMESAIKDEIDFKDFMDGYEFVNDDEMRMQMKDMFESILKMDKEFESKPKE